MAFLAYEPRETGLWVFASSSWLQLEADFDRNYLNGAVVETSTGSTDGSYSGVEVEIGYRFRVAARSAVTPFLSYQFGRSAFDGYTETGGALPGAISDQDAEIRTAKVGVGGLHAVSDRMEVSAAIAYGRARETLSAPGLSVSGLSGMLFSGASGDRDYDLASVSLGMNYTPSGRATLYSSFESQQALEAVADDIDAVAAHVRMPFAF